MIPDPHGTNKREFSRVPKPRIIKSHDPFDPRYPRIIYIVRDPRDVALSQYHYHRKLKRIEDAAPVETFITRFLAGQTCQHGSWGENVVTWLATRRDDRSFLLLRYEDMIADTAGALRKIADFLTLAVDAEQINRAVELSSASRMRRRQVLGDYKGQAFRHPLHRNRCGG